MDSVVEIIETGAVTPVYQPLVELDTGLVVGYEALARGPQGSVLERPDMLFDAARAAQVLPELDWVCRTAAVREAYRGRFRTPLTLFINSEPETIGSRMSAEFAEWWARARLAGLQIVFEITERAVMERPAELLRAADHIRQLGWGLALDDIGANPESLALLPFVNPDVIKLDMGLVQGTATDPGQVLLALNAETERTGAVLLAEGIETEEHLELARIFGATIGQGWYFGSPGPLPDPFPEAGPRISISKHEGEDASSTPYEIVTRNVHPRRLAQDHLVMASRLLEQRAGLMPHPPVMIAAFQHARRFNGDTVRVYEDLATKLPFVAVLAEGWDQPQGRPRRVVLEPEDPVAKEWIVGFVSPFSGMFLTARERDEGAGERSFDVAMTFDRDTAIAVAGQLLLRLSDPQHTSLQQSGEEVEFADAVAEILAAAERESDIARPLLDVMSRLTGLESTFLSRIHDEERYDVVVSHNTGSLEVSEGYSMPWTETICHDALVSNRVAFDDVQIALPDNRTGSEFGFHTYITCPVVVEDGRVVGTLCGASRERTSLSEKQIETVRRFARLVGRRLLDESDQASSVQCRASQTATWSTGTR